MTAEQYWDDDCTLVIAYRKAEQIRTDKLNRMMWLQGLYIYEGIGALQPIFNPFAKNGTKPKPYVTEPYPLTQERAEDKKEREEKAKFEQMKATMFALQSQINSGFTKKGGGKNG